MMQWTLQGSNEELKNVICLVWLQLISLVIIEHGHFLFEDFVQNPSVCFFLAVL